jgi:RimJ/RimL family protein N-acetyltransferase
MLPSLPGTSKSIASLSPNFCLSPAFLCVDFLLETDTIAKTFWRQGLATEVPLAIRDYAFGPLGLIRLVCLIDPGKRASLRVAEKMGIRSLLEFRAAPRHED